MTDDESLQVMIGDQMLTCRNVDDKIRLEPIGGILSDGSVEGYRTDELEAMASTLSEYNMPEALAELRQLMKKQTAP